VEELGPLLFLIFINDLPEQTTTSTSNLYADDSRIIAKVNNENDESLQREIKIIFANGQPNGHLISTSKNVGLCISVNKITILVTICQ
jgi:hypothetical protein